MNIHQAKLEIARTYRAYTKRGPDGAHLIPPEKQRPVLLIGPPGLGKTAIMRQIAEETGCGLVAYSMTHHTRQSAIGLPFISQKEYGGRRWSVTEYTMSEIVASIYDYMEATGKQSGMLFLDEINCVSETLTPVMLQLLQSKTFGNVPLPEDWMIVGAGNPSEYNDAVRELDMVTLDRVKRIDVEADLGIWQSYAVERGLHPAIRTYLSVYPDHFYRITDTDRGREFVTARGWEDLSLMLTAYEAEDIRVDADWFLQYLQHGEIARSFALYYDLFTHFSGEAATLGERLLKSPERLAECSSTECLAIAAMLFHPISLEADRLMEAGKRLSRRRELLSMLNPAEGEARTFFDQKRKALAIKVSHGTVSRGEEYRERAVLDALEADLNAWRKLPGDSGVSFLSYEGERIGEAEALRDRSAERVSGEVETAYRALSKCPQGRSAALYLTSDLSASPACAALLRDHPSKAHALHLKQLEA